MGAKILIFIRYCEVISWNRTKGTFFTFNWKPLVYFEISCGPTLFNLVSWAQAQQQTSFCPRVSLDACARYYQSTIVEFGANMYDSYSKSSYFRALIRLDGWLLIRKFDQNAQLRSWGKKASFYGSPFIRRMILPSEPLKERWFLRLLISKRNVWWTQKDEKEKNKFQKFVGQRWG